MKCSKCNGTGKISGFSHISNGVCFDCMGSGILPGAKKHTVKYARSYVQQFCNKGFFLTEISDPLKPILCIKNKGHKTAEQLLMEDDKEFKSLVKILNNKDNIQKEEKLKSKL